MNTEDLGNSKILNLLFKPAGILMGSRARRWLMNPMKTLQGSGIQPGQTVLEVRCGTGFFTIPAAQLIGDEGCLLAMDALSDTGIKMNGIFKSRRAVYYSRITGRLRPVVMIFIYNLNGLRS